MALLRISSNGFGLFFCMMLSGLKKLLGSLRIVNMNDFPVIRRPHLHPLIVLVLSVSPSSPLAYSEKAYHEESKV